MFPAPLPGCRGRRRPLKDFRARGTRLSSVVLTFEILLVLMSVFIAWLGLYVVYRLVTDES